MKRRDLPLSSLRAFESVGRYVSVSKAANELGVTHSAVSHHVRRLEDHLGVKLVRRSGQGVQLTTKGSALLSGLREGFDEIAHSVDSILGRKSVQALRITTTPTLASRWLIPRMSDWRRHRPDIFTDLDPTLAFVNVLEGEADVAIRCGQPPWPGLTAEFLRPILMAPVAAPTYVATHAVNEPNDLLRHDLIHADVGEHPVGEEWRMWFQASGVSVPASGDELTGMSFRDPGMALQAAIDGVGVAMAYLDLVADDLENGRLTLLCGNTVEHYFSYYLVYTPAMSEDSFVRAFRDWAFENFERTVSPPMPAAKAIRSVPKE